MARENRLTVRLSDREYAELKKVAQKHNSSGYISKFLRYLILKGCGFFVLDKKLLDEFVKTNKQLVGVARNLNQITHELNASKFKGDVNVDSILNEISAILPDIKKQNEIFSVLIRSQKYSQELLIQEMSDLFGDHLNE